MKTTKSRRRLENDKAPGHKDARVVMMNHPLQGMTKGVTNRIANTMSKAGCKITQT